MSLTRGNIIDRCAAILKDDSTEFRTHAAASLDNMMFYLWDVHDWEFKHKTGTFSTVAGTESYNLATSSTDMRSAQDLEVLYDTTNGTFIQKVDLKQIRKSYPKEDQSGDPVVYAPWGTRTIYMHPKPDSILVMHYLYLATPTLATADANNLQTVCGLPDYMHHVMEKLVLAEMMLYYDDSRYAGVKQEIETLLIPRAIAADMKHLESGAHIKFWEEELMQTGLAFDDFLRQTWWGNSE
jgi:hypothetical protein